MFSMLSIFAAIVSQSTGAISPKHSYVATHLFMGIAQCFSYTCMLLADQSLSSEYDLCESWWVSMGGCTLLSYNAYLYLLDSFSGYSVASAKMNRDSHRPAQRGFQLLIYRKIILTEASKGILKECTTVLIPVSIWVRIFPKDTWLHTRVRVSQVDKDTHQSVDDKSRHRCRQDDATWLLPPNWSSLRCEVLVGFRVETSRLLVVFCAREKYLHLQTLKKLCCTLLPHCCTGGQPEGTNYPSTGTRFSHRLKSSNASAPRGNKTPESIKRHLFSRFPPYPIETYVPKETSYAVRSGLLIVS
ncbi:LOW QUALITY PROTEIN: hypothetical protein T265_13790 [Opisthorchis viverrini]|uniref:Uncharacterized protein n=1 Tax=Opisthorchis viverrini TaxID=6198 RepID=A0A074ZVQ9_OPIVI|nr:LOW QUALITY PROTEIN: hypothetical protein T265_13790 [Opisthorchis viverrini]KER27465.1 LOW QUALITY PROTEIN: hypothetical protein T265_13790 [Opisthorchis viverrini]